MKSSFALFAAALTILAANSRADILWTYNFDTDGRITNTAGWRAYGASLADGTVSNAGGVVYVGAGAEDVAATNAYAAQAGQVFFGFSFNVATADSPTYLVGFFTGAANMSGRLYADDLSATTYRLGLSGDSTTATYATNVLTIGTTYSILLGYNNATDTHTLWINPTLSDELTPSLSITEGVTDNPNGVFIRQGDTWDNGEAAWTADNFAVATSFNNLVPEPGTALLALIGLGTLAAARRRLSA